MAKKSKSKKSDSKKAGKKGKAKKSVSKVKAEKSHSHLPKEFPKPADVNIKREKINSGTIRRLSPKQLSELAKVDKKAIKDKKMMLSEAMKANEKAKRMSKIEIIQSRTAEDEYVKRTTGFYPEDLPKKSLDQVIILSEKENLDQIIANLTPDELYVYRSTGVIKKGGLVVYETPEIIIEDKGDRSHELKQTEKDPFPGFNKVYSYRLADKHPIAIFDPQMKPIDLVELPNKIMGKHIGYADGNNNFYLVEDINGKEFLVSRHCVTIKK